MELTGTIKLVNDLQTFDSGFRKREFVLTTAEQYPQDVKFECVQDRVDLLEKYKAGDSVTVHMNIRGNEFNGKYYVNLQAWRIEKVEGVESKSGQAAPATSGDDSDALPF